MMSRTLPPGCGIRISLPTGRIFPGLAIGIALSVCVSTKTLAEQPARVNPNTVRDRLWVWAHEATVYDGAWGLPGPSRITPVEGACYMGIPNVIFIRYEGKPVPPFEQYAVPFKSLKRVYWSITGAGGATSDEERAHVFRLASAMPNITGVFMDDFFQFDLGEKPQWLAENKPRFPVELTITLPQPLPLTQIELTQSSWPSGDYRSADVAVDVTPDGHQWTPTAKSTLPNEPEAVAKIALKSGSHKAVRIRILSTHDTQGSGSCGLRRVRLWCGDQEVPLRSTELRAGSTYPGHEVRHLLTETPTTLPQVSASLSVQQLQNIRKQLDVGGRRLDLGVTLYTHQLTPKILPHLEQCDVVSLWTWRARDLKDLEASFATLKAMAPNRRILLGCYMWDFGDLKPMPIDLMRKQCELGLQWLRQGRIEGLIFLATNICDLNIESVEWSRRWIAQVADLPL